MGKAFGKLDFSKPLELRQFEHFFGITAREGPEAWKSKYKSAQNLLDHLSRFGRSEGSKEVYLNRLRRLCEWSNADPDRLVNLPKHKTETLLQKFVDETAGLNRSRAYVNSMTKQLRTFFRANGKTLRLHTLSIPPRYRKRNEYIPTIAEVRAMAACAGSLRNRALILTAWSSGLRVSTLCALNYGDLADDLNAGHTSALVPVYPKMKERLPNACKGNIPYYTFICREAVEALRAYLRDRSEKYGSITPEAPLFHAEWNLWERNERSSKRLGRRTIAKIIRQAARLSGISQWASITPHTMRKAFESVLRSPTIDGSRMDMATQQFFFGHILPGSQDAYYDKDKTDYHRLEYEKLNFFDSPATRSTDKLIHSKELEKHLNEGWMFIAQLDSKQTIVRRTCLV
ncbi:tyrosine-type recombinase/integrase [Candidatus Bathyarchaeota archaeon]|nr:tyrosine-type recombinase/integrase [Candidatus Bathyarchaeota archaeon]